MDGEAQGPGLATTGATDDKVAWKIHWWILGITGVPLLLLSGVLLYSAVTSTSEMGVGALIYGILAAVVWAIFAAGITVIFAVGRRFGMIPVLIGYLAAFLATGWGTWRFVH